MKELITTWILSHMHVENTRRSKSHLTSYQNGRMTVSYDPCQLWTFINSYHCSITEARLTVITSTLHSLKQNSTNSLTSHLDKFNLVLNEFYKFSGENVQNSSNTSTHKNPSTRIQHNGQDDLHDCQRPYDSEGQHSTP